MCFFSLFLSREPVRKTRDTMMVQVLQNVNYFIIESNYFLLFSLYQFLRRRALFLSDLSSQFYDFFFNYHDFFNNVDMMLKKDKYYIRSLHSMTFAALKFISGTFITLKSVKKI